MRKTRCTFCLFPLDAPAILGAKKSSLVAEVEMTIVFLRKPGQELFKRFLSKVSRAAALVRMADCEYFYN